MADAESNRVNIYNLEGERVSDMLVIYYKHIATSTISQYLFLIPHKVRSFGGAGRARGQLAFPNQMHVNAQQRTLTVVEMNNNRIQTFSLPEGIPQEVLVLTTCLFSLFFICFHHSCGVYECVHARVHARLRVRVRACVLRLYECVCTMCERVCANVWVIFFFYLPLCY